MNQKLWEEFLSWPRFSGHRQKEFKVPVPFVFDFLNVIFPLTGFSLCRPVVLDRLVGLVVKASASRAKEPVFESRLRRDFSGSSHTSDLKIGTPVATLPGAWRYRVSTGTGRPGVRVLWLGEVETLICSFILSLAARKIVWVDPFLRYTIACCWDVKQATNNNCGGWLVLPVWLRSWRVFGATSGVNG